MTFPLHADYILLTSCLHQHYILNPLFFSSFPFSSFSLLVSSILCLSQKPAPPKGKAQTSHHRARSTKIDAHKEPKSQHQTTQTKHTAVTAKHGEEKSTQTKILQARARQQAACRQFGGQKFRAYEDDKQMAGQNKARRQHNPQPHAKPQAQQKEE